MIYLSENITNRFSGKGIMNLLLLGYLVLYSIRAINIWYFYSVRYTLEINLYTEQHTKYLTLETALLRERAERVYRRALLVLLKNDFLLILSKKNRKNIFRRKQNFLRKKTLS